MMSSGWMLLVIVFLVAWMFDRGFRRYYFIPDSADERHYVRTRDNIRIALHRYRPTNDQKGPPVLLVHGLGANHRNLAFDATHGVAQVLCAQGFDCWAIDLRGRGASDVPRTPWAFETFIEFDLPPAIDHVLARTGAKKLHWVGHSMGGMLFYAMAGTTEYGQKIASAVTLGSPVRFYRARVFERVVLKFRRFLEPLGRFPAPIFARWLMWVLPLLPARIQALQYNPRLMRRHRLRRGTVTCVAAPGIRLLLQFSDWIVHHRWTTLDGSVDYRAGLDRIEVPTLVIAGGGDRLCPGFFVKLAYDRLATTDKKYVEAGVDMGMRGDYGHIDLVFGDYAPEEIFPQIGQWLADHSTERQAVGDAV